MTDNHTPHPDDLTTGVFEPDELDGHTLDELADYLDADRTPPNPSIDQSPGCQLALDALERLHTTTTELFTADTAAEPPADEGWVQQILGGILLDARAGRRIPLTVATANVDAGITEGAVRGLVRAVESIIPGIIIGRVRLDGDITQPAAPVRVQIEVSVRYGHPITPLVAQLRTEVVTRLATHTDLTVSGIDITVVDLQPPTTPKGTRP